MTDNLNAELVTTGGRTEADAVAEIATLAAVAPTEVLTDRPEVLGIAVPPGSRFDITDLERYLPAPRRVVGSTLLVDGESFATYYKKHQTRGASTMYANVKTQQIIAVLNDAADAESPGWRDHRLTLALAKTPEWQRWAAIDGHLLDQARFAEHIEDSTPDIVDPDAATMLEIAQSFHAHTSVTFESQKRLRDGQTQLQYREDTVATAGTTGQIEVPSVIQLSLAPFEVGEVYGLVARLRFRVNNGKLTIGVKLDRPDDVIRQAFSDVVNEVQQRTGDDVLYGTPPQ